MTIPYNYRVLSVNETDRNMSVLYTSEGYEDQVITIPLPVNSQTETDAIIAGAPIAFWKHRNATVVPVTVGTNGRIEPNRSPDQTILKVNRIRT